MITQKRPLNARSPRGKQGTEAVLVLDVGTTGIKAFVFDATCQIRAKAYRPIGKKRPRHGWVEQDPGEILRVSKAVLREAVKRSGIGVSRIRGVGLTNQREATVLWDRQTGKPVYPVIGWEDVRTKRFCESFSAERQDFVRRRTGLPIDSYFSASKIRWILDRVPRASQLADDGRLAFGTIDGWLLWNLCEGMPHLTDETNASRTLLFNVRTRRWDRSLLDLFGIPASLLPTVLPSRARFGMLDGGVVGRRIPLLAMCGDQQASMYAAIRRASTAPVTKVTYGTGTFLTQSLGKRFRLHPPFLTALVPDLRGTTFALEGKIKGTGEAVGRRLGDPKKLHAFLQRLARDVNAQLERFPSRPLELIADGGIIRDAFLLACQARVSGVPVLPQIPYDGTALGTALLAFDALRNSSLLI